MKNIPAVGNVVTEKLVLDLIRSTEYSNGSLHANDASDKEFKIVHDLDFSSMANTYDQFLADGQAIRREYWYISQEDYNLGRKAFLGQLLDKKHIFMTKYFRDKYEENAKRNIATLLSEANK